MVCDIFFSVSIKLPKFPVATVVVWMLCASSPTFAEEPPTCNTSVKKGETCRCTVADLHPTQITVGMKEVESKEKSLAQKSKDELETYLHQHPEAAVKGPEGKLYIIDHHHLARALLENGIKTTHCQIVEDLGSIPSSSFWATMEKRQWVYPYDEAGKRVDYASIPLTIRELRDDPYRSLAGAVRDACGYQKSQSPFAEFLWANFLRSRVALGNDKHGFKKAVKQGLLVSHSGAAKNLPGYCGTHCSCNGSGSPLTTIS